MHCDVFKYIIIRDAGSTGAAGASAPLAFCISNQGIGTGGARAPPPQIFAPPPPICDEKYPFCTS